MAPKLYLSRVIAIIMVSDNLVSGWSRLSREVFPDDTSGTCQQRWRVESVQLGW